MEHLRGKEDEKNQILSFIKHMKLNISDPKFPALDPPDFQFIYRKKKISLEHTRLFITNGGKIKSTITPPVDNDLLTSLITERIEDKNQKEHKKHYSSQYDENWLLIVLGEDLYPNFATFESAKFNYKDSWVFCKVFLYSIQNKKHKTLRKP